MKNYSKYGDFGLIEISSNRRHWYLKLNYTLQAEGIFRINAENSQEEYVRDQLNRGVIPDGIDVHCLAGLIKVRIYRFLFRYFIVNSGLEH